MDREGLPRILNPFSRKYIENVSLTENRICSPEFIPGSDVQWRTTLLTMYK